MLVSLSLTFNGAWIFRIALARCRKQEKNIMLVLTRHVGQEIVIGNDIRIVLLEVRGEQARIGIDAPPAVRVDRLEVQLRRMAAQEKAVENDQVACLTN